MSCYVFVFIDVLDIVYLEWNLQGVCSVVLLYGWLDSLYIWKDLVEFLVDVGYWVLVLVFWGFVLICFCDVFILCSG